VCLCLCHQVKPLQIIWSKFPQWSCANTVHLDDLSRNFALNPGCGLKVGHYLSESGQLLHEPPVPPKHLYSICLWALSYIYLSRNSALNPGCGLQVGHYPSQASRAYRCRYIQAHGIFIAPWSVAPAFLPPAPHDSRPPPTPELADCAPRPGGYPVVHHVAILVPPPTLSQTVTCDSG
jgi:hypothetical protein